MTNSRENGMAGAFEVDPAVLRAKGTLKWRLYGPDVLPAWVAETDFALAPPVRRALVEAVEREAVGYPDADAGVLADACTAFLARRFGWEVSPRRITPVATIMDGVRTALDVHGPPGCGVVVLTPAYPPFFEAVTLGGRRPVPVAMVADGDRWVLDLDAVDAALAGDAAVVLLCQPQNPTGRAFTAEELAALAAVVDRHGARVVSDEVHGPLTLPGATYVPYASVGGAAADHSVTVTGATKAFNIAGLKCAQVITTNHADAEAWRSLPVLALPSATPLGVAATVAAYREGDDWLDALLAHLDDNRRRLDERLATDLAPLSWRPSEATFLTWLDATALGTDDPAAFLLDRARVAVNDGAPFGPGWEQFVRLNIGTSRALLDTILDALAGAVQEGTAAG